MPYPGPGENMDYPTAWAIQKVVGLNHTDPKCSAVQTGGALLCDCEALWDKWRELGKPSTADAVRIELKRLRTEEAHRRFAEPIPPWAGFPVPS